MKKVLLFIIFSAIFLCCVSCAEYSKYQKQQSSIVANSYVFPAFNKIVVSGNARVELIDKGGLSYLYCNGMKRDVDNIGAYVKGDTLYISSTSSAPYMWLNISNPRFITVMGNAFVRAGNLTSKKLGIAVNGNSSITLHGKIGLTMVNQVGSGKVDVRWVDSVSLIVTSSGSGPIYLSGSVKKLTAKLQGRAYLEARYLRAEAATVMTTGLAQAHVLATDILDAYADKASNVYYHKRPQQLNKVSFDSGNVFLIGEIP